MQFLNRTYIMGILNVTPDSFSDGGKFLNLDAALSHAESMVKEGADIIDVGAESTRPNASPISAEEELYRIIPFIERLAANLEVTISIDTYKADVAREALKAGATMLNDIWGLKLNSEMAQVAAEFNVPVIIMHNQKGTLYKDFLNDVTKSLEESIHLALEAGVLEKNIIIDPGFGFGKDTQQNLYLLKNMEILKNLDYPILVGTSRKSMIGNTLNLPTYERLEGTAATVVLAITKGANIIRVHDVKEMTRVARMTDAVMHSKLGGAQNG